MKKICLSFGPGGHMDQLFNIKEVYKSHKTFFVTPKRASTEYLAKISKTYLTKQASDFSKNNDVTLISLLLCYVYLTFVSFKILLKEKPDVIIANGGPATIPLSYLGKIFGVKIIYLESLARMKDISGTAKFVYPISDLFLVQWKSLSKKLSKAKYWGKVI